MASCSHVWDHPVEVHGGVGKYRPIERHEMHNEERTPAAQSDIT